MNGIQTVDYDIDIQVEKDAAGKIASGMVVGDILYQNQALILGLHKGELHSQPSVGVGISDALLDHDFGRWTREIREQLELDGQTVTSVKMTENSLQINSTY